MNRPIEISLLQSRTDNQPISIKIDGWPAFVDEMSEHQRRAEKDGPAWAPAVFTGGRRSNANVRDVSLLVLDCDSLAPGEPQRICARLEKAGLSFLVHSTHTSTPETPKVRVIVDVDRQIRSDELRILLEAFASKFDFEIDHNAVDPARLFYLPSCKPGSQPFVYSAVGVPLPVDACVGEHVSLKAAESACDRSLEASCVAYIRGELARAMPAIEGNGGEPQTFRVGAMLVNDFALTPMQAVELAREWNARCIPPWSEDELLRKFENSGRYANGKRGCRRAECEAQTPFEQQVAIALREVEARARVSATGGTSNLLPLAVLLESSEPPVDWLVEGLITKRAVVGIGAEPKSAKTWAALELALAVASGRSAFGDLDVPQATPVALFMLEDDQSSVRARLEALARGRGESLANVASKVSVQCRGTLDLMDPKCLASIIASCRIQREVPALVVIDPLRDAHQGEENDSGDMSRVMDGLRAIRDLVGCSVLFIHHSAKAGAETGGRRGGQRLRGSSAIHGSLDGGLYLSELKGDLQTEWVNRAETEVKGARAAGGFFLRLLVEDNEVTKTAERAEWALSREPFPVSKRDERHDRERMDRIVKVLESFQADGGPVLSMTKIAERAGVRKSDAAGLLKQLKVEGKVIQESRGGWRAAPCVPSVPSGQGTGEAEQFLGSPPLRVGTEVRGVPEIKAGVVS